MTDQIIIRNKICLFFLYGAITATFILGVRYTMLPVKVDLMGARVYLAQLFLQGGTLSWIADSMYQIADFHIAYYFYIALYGLLTGQIQAESVYVQIQTIAFGVLFLILPYCVVKSFHSLRLVLVSPFLFFLLIWQYFLHVYYTDYWGMGWAIFISLPLFFVFLKKCDTTAALWKAYIALCILAGVANIPRAHAGIGIITVAIFLMLYSSIYRHVGWNIWKKVVRAVMALVIAASGYFMFTSMLPNIYLSVFGYDYTMTATKAYKLGSWHTLYIGLGWDSPTSISPKLSFLARENPYDIVFLDECAMEAVSRENHIPIPARSYTKIRETFGDTTEARTALSECFTAGYFDILKNLYLKAFEEHPLWFVGSYIKKSFVCVLMLLKDTLAYMIFVGIVYFAMRKKYPVHIGSVVGKDLYGVLLVLTFFGFLPGLIAVPSHVYLLGSIAAVQSICFLVLLEILASTPYFRKDENIYG